ncbi:MAG TPA: D-isomer specific 2-hydroxyacid dehydrogenase family protein [Actinomycetota bacterium]|nr:D-isomer specific 2-hydroxyacid dehydrogenase family protein [Actinomycetota bacterium]
MTRPAIAIEPATTPELEAAVTRGGGRVVTDTATADAIVWVNPRDPEGLKDLLKNAPARWVQLPFAGIESFVAAGVIDHGRTWTCTKGVYGPACAEHALALMLAAARRLHRHARDKKWRRGGFGSPERRLNGTTAVILGTGGIGSSLVEMLRPLGVRMIGVNRSGTPLAGAERTVTVEHLADVAVEADWLVVAAASTPATRHIVDARVLEALPGDAWVVNVARGELVDTDALLGALTAGAIGGAALDVTEPEPLPERHPLWDQPDVIITPHVANTWDMAVPELVALVERNVARFASGESLEGVVDPASGY